MCGFANYFALCTAVVATCIAIYLLISYSGWADRRRSARHYRARAERDHQLAKSIGLDFRCELDRKVYQVESVQSGMVFFKGGACTTYMDFHEFYEQVNA